MCAVHVEVMEYHKAGYEAEAVMSDETSSLSSMAAASSNSLSSLSSMAAAGGISSVSSLSLAMDTSSSEEESSDLEFSATKAYK